MLYFTTRKYGIVRVEVAHKGDWFRAFYACVMGPIAIEYFTHKPMYSELKRSAEKL